MKSGTIMRLTSRAMMFVAGMTLAACQAIYANHGYVPTDRELDEVKVGQTTREQLGPLIGPPSSSGVLEGSGWYYVQSRWEHYGAFAPKEVERQVVAISFAPNGVVSNVERFGLEDGNVVTLSRRTTETNIKGVGIVQQLLGNVGRMNASQFIDTPSTNN